MLADVDEGAPVKKLVAPSAPTVDDWEEKRACCVQDLVS